MADGHGNGTSSHSAGVEHVTLHAEVVQNDPADTYVVVRLLPDGPEVRLPKDVVVKAPPEGD